MVYTGNYGLRISVKMLGGLFFPPQTAATLGWAHKALEMASFLVSIY